MGRGGTRCEEHLAGEEVWYHTLVGIIRNNKTVFKTKRKKLYLLTSSPSQSLARRLALCLGYFFCISSGWTCDYVVLSAHTTWRRNAWYEPRWFGRGLGTRAFLNLAFAFPHRPHRVVAFPWPPRLMTLARGLLITPLLPYTSLASAALAYPRSR